MTLIEQLEAKSKALTANEVAELLGISKQHVYEMAADGRLPAFRVGRSIRFDPQEIADCLRKGKPEGEHRFQDVNSPKKAASNKGSSGKKESASMHRVWRDRVNHLEAATAIDGSVNR